MFCSNCGNQLPDGTKFCNNCGAQLSANESPAAAPSAAQKAPEKAAKKKPNIIVVLAVVLCAFLLGKFVIAPSMSSDSGKETKPNEPTTQTQQQTTTNNSGDSANTTNSAYDAVFEDTYIVHFQAFFNMDMASFASKQANGIICCSDYGYKDDVVKHWVETMYIPVSGLTEAEKAKAENEMKTQFAVLDALTCCTANYKMGTNYLTVTFTYKDVDQAANYGELYNAGILQTNTFISMSATESTLLSQGFVKK